MDEVISEDEVLSNETVKDLITVKKVEQYFKNLQVADSKNNEVTLSKTDDPIEKILWAAEHNHVSVVEKMLQENPDLMNVKDSDGYSPLHRASSDSKNLSVVKMLLTKGANVRSPTIDGWHPLHCAAKWNCFQIASFLLQNGADVNAQSNGGQTPLHIAAANRDSFEMLRLFLCHPFVDVNIRNSCDETAFMLAERHGPHSYLFDIHDPAINEI